MLKNIPKILSPELLKVLCEMGHSDRIVIADGNFPAESMGKNAIVIRCDGHGVPELLDAILKVFPVYSKMARSLVRKARTSAAERRSGSVTISMSGTPQRLQSTSVPSGRWMSLPASSSM